jgi:hypothetical protein
MGPVRTFALTAALSVVVLHLLPESMGAVGAWAVLVFLAGLFTPEALGRLGTTLWRMGRKSDAVAHDPRRRHELALEASYFGLLLHRVGDGVGLGAFTLEMHAWSGSGGVITAMAAHAVPVVALVVLTFDSLRGRDSAIRRAVGLAVASVIGVFLARGVPEDAFEIASPWIAAFVGGMLLHVVTHDLSVSLPKTKRDRVLDLCAGAAGIVVSSFGNDAHGHGEKVHAVDHFADALLDFSVETGPLLLLGVGIGALLSTWGAKIPARFFQSRGTLADAARGTLVGAPLPLCSCSVLPISASLRGRGAAPALVVAFLLATPELGVETFALSVRFLGWELAWLRLAGALCVAFLAAVVVGSLQKRVATTSLDSGATFPGESAGEGHFARRVLHSFDELLHHIGAWMILGVVAAALTEVALPPGAFSGVKGWLAQFGVITLVAIPSYVCAPSATPLAAVLLAKGISPGAVLVGLLLGPATNVATVVFLRRWFGGRSTFWGILAVVASAWALGLLVDTVLQPTLLTKMAPVGAHSHSAWVLWVSVGSGLVILRAVYRTGFRGFLAPLQGEHGHDHAPSDAHGAPQGHGHAH